MAGENTVKPRVLVTDKTAYELIDALKREGFEVDYLPGIEREDLLERVGDYHVLVVRGRTKVTSEVIERGCRGRLRVVARAGIGLDNIDLEAARRCGVRVVNTPDASTQSVAELALGLMIAAARRIVEGDRLVKEGGWVKLTGVELYGKTLLVVGYGRIGKRLSQIARALGMRVIACDLPEVLEGIVGGEGVEKEEDLCTALSRADFVSLHVPLTPETRHLINRGNIRCFKRGAILVNTSRGAVVETEALLEALEEGIIRAAALDVMEHEPPSTEAEKRLARHPKVVVTPHIGAQTVEAQLRIAEQLPRLVKKALAEALGTGIGGSSGQAAGEERGGRVEA